MLSSIYKIVVVTLLTTLLLSGYAYAGSPNPDKKYQHQGLISAVDKARRLLTIDGKVYKVSVGVKFANLPRKYRYSGMQMLDKDVNIYFDLQHGTESLSLPSISEIWLLPN